MYFDGSFSFDFISIAAKINLKWRFLTFTTSSPLPFVDNPANVNRPDHWSAKFYF